MDTACSSSLVAADTAAAPWNWSNVDGESPYGVACSGENPPESGFFFSGVGGLFVEDGKSMIWSDDLESIWFE